MKLLPLLLLSVLFSLSDAFSNSPLSLILRTDGIMELETQRLENLEFRFVVKDVSSGSWGPVVVEQKSAPVSGVDIERVEKYRFVDGENMGHQTVAKVSGKTVGVDSTWVNSCPYTLGFARTDLWFPEALAEDIIVTMGGVKIYPLDDGQARRAFPRTDVLVVASKSTGAVLFQVDGEFVTVTPFYILAKPEMGMSLNFSAVVNDVGCTVSEGTSLVLKLVFPD